MQIKERYKPENGTWQTEKTIQSPYKIVYNNNIIIITMNTGCKTV